LRRADLVIGAVLLPGAEAPRVVSREQLALLRPGRVLVDIAIDQGGCIEGIQATDWRAPAYHEKGLSFIAVTNLPGAVPRTATEALSAAVLPRLLELLAATSMPAADPPWLASAKALSRGRLCHPALRGAA
jgi:alanine dehydrogenase